MGAAFGSLPGAGERLEKLLLKRVTPVAPAEAKAPEGGTPTT